ncbi:MAG: S-layer homology domain-containing protein [Filifactor alocis]|nr:S-layer homology domain-containing protein [Filifactor alocis]
MKQSRNRILSLFLILTMIAGVVPQSIFANEKVEVSTQEELAAIQGGNYVLTRDIVLDENWEAISEFDGELDGNGKTITSFGESVFSYINRGALVKNLIVKGKVSGNKSQEPIRLGGLAEVVRGRVQNTLIDIDLIRDEVYDSVGGVAGYLDGGEIDAVVANIRLTTSLPQDDIDDEKVSGLIGELESGTVNNSYWIGIEQGAYLYDEESLQASEKIEEEALQSEELKDKLNSGGKEGYLPWGMNEDGKLMPGGGRGSEKREVLRQLVEDMSKVDAAFYTPESFRTFEEELNRARSVLEETSSSDDEIQTAIESLKRSFAELLHLPLNKDELRAKVEEYKALDFSLYRKDSILKMKTLLQKAEQLLETEIVLQAELNRVKKDLEEQFSVMENRIVDGVDISSYGTEIIAVTDPEQLKNMDENKVYRLEKDLQIPSGWLNPNEMNTIFDGNGHKIELQGNTYFPIFDVVGERGIIQNLGIEGGARYNFEAGGIAGVHRGLIINSYSLADIESVSGAAGGLVGFLDGGSIVNCYVSAQVKAPRLYGALAGRSEYGFIRNSYWNDRIDRVSSDTDKLFLKDSREMGLKDLKTKEFIDRLNLQRNSYLKSWGRQEYTGLPYHGKDFEFESEQDAFRYPVKFTDVLGRSTVLDRKGRIHVNYILGDKDFLVGKLELVGSDLEEGKIHWTTLENHTENIRPGIESGDVYSYGGGVTTVQVYTVNDEKERMEKIAEFDLVGKLPKIEDMQAFVADRALEPNLDGLQNVAKNKFVIEGRQYKELVLKARFEGSSEYVDINEYNFDYRYDFRSDADKKKFKHNRGEFVFEEPYKTRFFATVENFETYVDLESSYVPVRSIKPIEGTFEVHARNSMSLNFDFMPLTGSGVLIGEDTNQPVVVEPKNASYGSKWELTSSDPSIVNYVPYIIVSLVPYKAGEVELTATSLDPNAERPVSGTSKVNIVYKNPLRSIDLTKSSYRLKEEDEIPLEMKLNGSNTTEEHVSEPKIEWRYEGSGRVEIGTKRKYIDQGIGKPFVADDQYYVKAIQEGHVKATGHPIDRTNDIEPIVLEFEVGAGVIQPNVNITELVEKGLEGGKNHFLQKFLQKDYRFGDEWAVFALSRSGLEIDPEKKEAYIKSVKEAYSPTNDFYVQNQKPTTIARTMIALGALGVGVDEIREYDFVEKLLNNKDMSAGLNESVYALIAIDTKNYSDQGYRWDRKGLVDEILSYQNPQTGGFGLYDNTGSGIDMTAMALQALSRYTPREDVREAVERGLKYLRDNLDTDMGYQSSEAVAQTVIALTALKMDALDDQNGFHRNDRKNIVTALMKFYDETTGGFKHEKNSQTVNDISTVQAMQALNSYLRHKADRPYIYDYSDVFGDPQEEGFATIHSIVPVNSLKVDMGTDMADVIRKLPSHTLVVDDQGRTHKVELNWSLETYNGHEEGEYNAIATFSLPPEVRQATPAVELVVKTKVIVVAPSSLQDMTVYFTLNAMEVGGNTELTWISRQEVIVPENSTVYTVFDKVLGEHSISYINKGNYISSIRSPYDGQWLSEFTNGKNSGWMYKVNGEHVNYGLEEYVLKDRDEVIWHYTNDYTKLFETQTPNGGSGGGGGASTPKSNFEELKVRPVLRDSLAEANIDSSSLPDIDSLMSETTSDVLTFDVKSGKTVERSVVTMSGAVMDKLCSEEKFALKLKTDLLEAEFDRDAIKVINEERKKREGSFVFSVRRVEKISEAMVEKISSEGEQTLRELLGRQPVFNLQTKVAGKEISSYHPGGMTIRLPYKLQIGEDKDTLKVYKIGSNGELSPVKHTSYDAIEEVMTFKTAETGLYVIGIGQTLEKVNFFSDVYKDSWYAPAVEELLKRGIISGREDRRFHPDEKISRAEFVTLLAKSSGDETQESKTSFEDVQQGDWYYHYVRWAKEKDLVAGYKNEFRPNDPITREEIAVILKSYYHQYATDQTTDEKEGFEDEKDISLWARDAVDMMKNTGVISGNEKHRFMPKKHASRAEAVQMLYKLLKNKQ